MVATRFFVALAAIPIIIFIIVQGGLLFFIALAALLFISTYEYYKIIESIGWPVRLEILLFGVMLMLIDGQWGSYLPQDLLLLIFLFSALLYLIWRYEYGNRDQALMETLALGGGVMLIGWLGKHMISLRGLDANGFLLICVISFVWSADTGAFFVGRQFGRRPLSPRISPNKSVEGYLGGILFSFLIGIPFSLFVLRNGPSVPLGQLATLAFALAVLSPAGDLGVSLLKRTGQVKDSGSIIPGHGGLLDRFDSLLWGCAIAYYLFLAFA